MNCSDWLISGLRERGVEWIATLCGHGLDPLYHAAKRAGMRLVDTRNEQTAAYLAVSCGRLTRTPGVVAVSSGVAHANAMSGVVDAYFDGSPLLLISGAADLRTAGMGHFQDLDHVALAKPATRYARVIDYPERTLEILQEAWAAASGPTPGPVHLTFPMDIQNTEVAPDKMIRPVVPAVIERSNQFEPGSSCQENGPFDELVSALGAAQRPLIVAGSGVYYAREGEALLKFCGEFAVPVVTPIWDRGSIDRASPVFMGVIGAATGGARLLADADVIVLAGAASDYRVGYLQPPALGDHARVFRMSRGFEALTSAYREDLGKMHSTWLADAASLRDAFRKKVADKAEKQTADGMHALHIVNVLRELGDSAVLLVDGGSIGQWAHQLLCDRYPGHWLTCGRSGVIGWGLGGSMAARLVYPDRPVVLVAGDGSFTFTPAEIECAVRQHLPFVAIVADDQAWGITKTGHEAKYGEAISSTLGAIDFVKMAESFGARGVKASSEEGLRAALAAALAVDTVTVIHVPIVGGNP